MTTHSAGDTPTSQYHEAPADALGPRDTFEYHIERLRTLFGRNVRRLRTEQGLTQAVLAAQAGINRSYLGGVERGQRRIGIENIARLAQALGVSADVLFRSPDGER